MTVRRNIKSPQKSTIAITPQDCEWARRNAPEALDYYHRYGLGEVRSLAVNIILSGAIPLLGMAFFHWSVLTMLMYMVADAAVTILADLIRYPIARKSIYASHAADQKASKVLLICDGLEDGSGQRTDNGVPGSPAIILFFSVASLLFFIPLIGAASEHAGLDPLREIVTGKSFIWIVGLNAAWRCLSGVVESIMARYSAPGDKMIFLESGGVAVQYIGLLCLVWLPLNWGHHGLVAMFIIMYLVRLAFGIFAYWWMPRSVSVVERRVKDDDFKIKQRSST